MADLAGRFASLRSFGGQSAQAQPPKTTRPSANDRRMADAVRALALDAAAAIDAGWPGMAMDMADAVTSLWLRHLKFDAADPRWPDRDRFVLSAGHGAPLLYGLLHLTGHAGMGAGELRRFGQFGATAAAHPEFGTHPAIEVGAGPPGQGLAAAVGMALAERSMAARFGRSLVDHRTWVVACAADMAEGVGQEAATLAGQLRLEKLTVLWNDDGEDEAGRRDEAREDVARRLVACGWAAKEIDGHDSSQIVSALSMALRSKKPTLIACRTAARSIAARGSEFAQEWAHGPFELPPALVAQWRRAGERGATARRGWLKRLARHPLRAEFERVVAGRLPDNFFEAIASTRSALARESDPLSPFDAGRRTLDALTTMVPEMLGGVASRVRPPAIDAARIGPGTFSGRYFHGGARAHGTAAALNGLSLHGGVLPHADASLMAADHLRPALRMAAIMRLRVVHALVEEGEAGAVTRAGGYAPLQTGPGQTPAEQLATLRAMPNLHVFRPGCALDVVESWDLAARRIDGPSVLVLSRRDLPRLRTDVGESRCARGGYVLAEASGPRAATLIASGPELAAAVEARDLLAAEDIAIAVVAMPCWELFAAQSPGYRASVLGGAPRFGVEAGCGFGWERWLGPDGVFLGIPGFAASGPVDHTRKHFGLTPDAIANSIRKTLNTATEPTG